MIQSKINKENRKELVGLIKTEIIIDILNLKKKYPMNEN